MRPQPTKFCRLAKFGLVHKKKKNSLEMVQGGGQWRKKDKEKKLQQ